ncbi:MAG: hypothetical protein WDZ83_10490 [Rhizobiaceae bacterium]
MLRFFFLLLILAGAAVGIGYPWAASNVAGYEIGTWRVFERDAGFSPVEANITPSEAPVSITVDLRATGALDRAAGEPILFMEATGEDGTPVVSAALDFAEAEARTINPQSGETAYREVAANLAIVDRDRYRFVFRPADGIAAKLVSVDLILNAGALNLDPRAIPAGFILIAVGVVGFAASLFRRRRENPNSKPPPRWGRGK